MEFKVFTNKRQQHISAFPLNIRWASRNANANDISNFQASYLGNNLQKLRIDNAPKLETLMPFTEMYSKKYELPL
jgi:hypothetical protein